MLWLWKSTNLIHQMALQHKSTWSRRAGDSSEWGTKPCVISSPAKSLNQPPCTQRKSLLITTNLQVCCITIEEKRHNTGPLLKHYFWQMRWRFQHMPTVVWGWTTTEHHCTQVESLVKVLLYPFESGAKTDNVGRPQCKNGASLPTNLFLCEECNSLPRALFHKAWKNYLHGGTGPGARMRKCLILIRFQHLFYAVGSSSSVGISHSVFI